MPVEQLAEVGLAQPAVDALADLDADRSAGTVDERPSRVARYTWPKPPSPSRRSIRYVSCVSGLKITWSGLRQRQPHSRQPAPERGSARRRRGRVDHVTVTRRHRRVKPDQHSRARRRWKLARPALSSALSPLPYSAPKRCVLSPALSPITLWCWSCRVTLPRSVDPQPGPSALGPFLALSA